MKKLLLIDGHSILNRAFFGLPDLTNAKGVHTNAVYGFLNIMFKFIDTEKPDYLTVAFDVHAPTFRHKMYADYKGTRGPMADELKQQVPMIKEMLHAMDIVTVEKEGWEADDILGTLADRAKKAGCEVVIISGDRDLLQLADEHVRIAIPKTKKTGTEVEQYYAKDVLEQKKVTPSEFIDVKALMGDSSDNIPGVPGIGEKTATAIIEKYHSIEEAYAHVDELKPPRASKNLKEFYDQAVMSKELATIVCDADVEYDMQGAAYGNPYTDEAYLLCKEWEFKNILPRFDLSDNIPIKEVEFERFIYPMGVEDYLNGLDTSVLGLYLYEKEGKALGLSVSDGESGALVTFSSESEAITLLQDIINTSDYEEFCVRDLKGMLHSLDAIGADSIADELLDKRHDHRVFDAQIASYLINPMAKTYTSEDIARDAAGLTIPSYTDLFGKTKENKAWTDKPDEMTTYLGYEAYTAVRSHNALCDKLIETDMEKLYYDIELPLCYTLFAMEREGIAIDRDELKSYGEGLGKGIDELTASIYDKAGGEFNINSPKQLGEVLFEKMGLKGGKKTKTGYSTAADVLEKLAADNPIVAEILEYRTLSKLKSTYADGLESCIDEDGRIRTTFEQTVAATGRLSSINPNLQNIPIRLEQGKLIRKVFHPRDGYTFVDADYSQIELRVLAHMSGDENLIAAYRQDRDIHRATASLVFKVPFEEVSQLQRRQAKAVNFGIVYGISAFGLGEDLGISRKDAQKYIDDYYEAYPLLKGYLDGCIESAKENGYSLTLFNRRRPIPELASGNFMQRSFGERVAMNAPIQGTAADIIKIAMNRVYDRLRDEGLESKLILQVHDELLIEAKTEEKDEVIKVLQEEMEGAAELAVKLAADIHTGDTWYDAK